jgi:hypothetical protein
MAKTGRDGLGGKYVEDTIQEVWVARWKHEPLWTIRRFLGVTRRVYASGEPTRYTVEGHRFSLGLCSEECFLTEAEARGYLVDQARLQRASIEELLAAVPTSQQLLDLPVHTEVLDG